jgi:hypothetical protein
MGLVPELREPDSAWVRSLIYAPEFYFAARLVGSGLALWNPSLTAKSRVKVGAPA